jgi:ribosomal protein L29
MKVDELRKKSNEELLELKKDFEFGLVKASGWGRGIVTQKESGARIKGYTKKGEKTSLQRDIRRNIARINTILNER